ncbi:cysteine--tRNA ligase [Bradyrhizobium mercantei]|uniref:cysteine--tRNA ligase n=1 Tax=Bradyrhizobium mercantei TaxID=1904807 RepID=UPI0009766A30|nr:cysteine--tRNA ligase [Bradyrhizobium mercantei]
MELRLYDTLTREKRPFVPLDANNVRIYACGPTVYDFAHIGNGRAAIVFDVLFRVLRYRYGTGHVTYVRNITDVDDKINVRAARDYPGVPLNEAIRKVTELTYQQYQDDVTALGCLPPTVQPRATEHIPEMRAIIEKLVAGGFAYVAEDHVLFSPQAMNAVNSVLPRYGALSKRSLDEMIAGARVDVAPYKRDNTDFVLWKPSKPGEPSWPSPAGIAVEGRPGWHIECSAMAWKHLGEKFDIHGGGIDLVFPHHENELAQTCCAFHTDRMANVWMHNGFLQIESEKMSKSLGNFFTIRDLLADWPGEVLRLSMLKTHYRSPLDWTLKALKESEKTIEEWHEILGQSGSDAANLDSSNREIYPPLIEALYDDLNTAKAIAEVHSLRSAVVHSAGKGDVTAFGDVLELLGLYRGVNIAQQARELRQLDVDLVKVNELIAERTAARARKDFKESDRIRDELAAMGVAIKDGKDADGKPLTTWEVAR